MMKEKTNSFESTIGFIEFIENDQSEIINKNEKDEIDENQSFEKKKEERKSSKIIINHEIINMLDQLEHEVLDEIIKDP